MHQGKFLVLGGESGSQETAHSEVEALDPDAGTWETLPHLIRGRHGTQAIYFDDMIVIGAGAGDRGGGPELTSFEIFATEENPEILPNTITQSEITVSEESLRFSSGDDEAGKQLTLMSRNGNQAALITGIHLDNHTDFSIRFPAEIPFALAPGKDFHIDINPENSAAERTSASAMLLITVMGIPEPLSIKLELSD